MQKFREFMLSKGFVGIHTPKLNAGFSEGGGEVFKLQYNGPVFRAENSKTPKHLCEFTGLDAEMEIKEHYFEVC